MHTLELALDWSSGERSANLVHIAFGLLLIGCAGLLWRLGATPAPRALVWPLLAAGALMIVLSIVTEIGNARRVAAYAAAYESDPVTFAEQEIVRMQGIMAWYFHTFGAGSAIIIGGVAAFLLIGAPMARAIALAALIIGSAVLFSDFLSKDRAKRYLYNLVQLTGPPAG